MVLVLANRYSSVLAPVLWSLANVDGTIFKFIKTKLFDETEKHAEHYMELVSSGAYIYDGICLIQQLEQSLNTFCDASDIIFKE